MKISNVIKKLKGRKAGIKVTVQNDIITEQKMIEELQAKLVAMWEAVVSSGGATEEDVATMDLLTIELERRKSPFLTNRDFNAPSLVIFCFVLTIYFELSVSPIFIQFIPSSLCVIYFSIGLGEPPRSMVQTSPSLT